MCTPKEVVEPKARPVSAFRRRENPNDTVSFIPTEEPEFLENHAASFQVQQVKPVLKHEYLLNRKEQELLNKQSYVDQKAKEVIQLPDDALINNFEVDFKEEKETPLAGGIKGIKALRVARDEIN